MAEFSIENSPPDDVVSKIQNFDNIKNLAFSLLRMERFNQDDPIKLKFDVKRYDECEAYSREIERMVESATKFDVEKPKIPIIKLQPIIPSIPSVLIFDLSKQGDIDIYLNVLKDGSICKRILSSAMIMQYMTELLDLDVDEDTNGPDEFSHEFSLSSPSGIVTGTITKHIFKNKVRRTI